VTKVNSNGTELWSNTISLASNNGILYGGKMIHQTFDNGYIICADAKGSEIAFDNTDVPYYTLIKTDSTGQELWRETFDNGGINSNSNGNGVGLVTGNRSSTVRQNSDGSFILCGTNLFHTIDSDPYTGLPVVNTSYERFIIKYNGLTSSTTLLTNHNRKLKKIVDLLGRETKQTNQPLFYIYDDGTVEKRIVIE
jgi:hypothetical protein